MVSITVAEGNPWFHANGNCLIETATKTLVRGCSTSVIPNDGSVEILAGSSFYEAEDMKELIIPKSVKELSGAFYVLPELESITVEEGNSKYHSSGNCLIDTDTKTLILGCNNSVIPTDGSVTVIGNSAFDGQELTGIVIPDCITEIGKYVFSGCKNLSNVVLPDGITEIKERTFSWCTNLTTLTIPNSVKKIDSEALGHCEELTVYFKGTKEQWDAIEKHPEYLIWAGSETQLTVIFQAE